MNSTLTVLFYIVRLEINIGFGVSTVFPVITRFFWPWHRSWWGWNTILLELSIAGCLLPSFLYLDFGISGNALEWSTVVFLGLVITNVVWRTVIIWNTQRAGALPSESSSVNRGSDAR